MGEFETIHHFQMDTNIELYQFVCSAFGEEKFEQSSTIGVDFK